MDASHKAREIIQQMMEKDAFSQWLGIQVEDASPGYCRLSMTIRPDMCNGFGIAHGGITFSLADSALAFASNSAGRHAVSIDTSIAHLQPLSPGEKIIAEAKELHLSNKIGLYHVHLYDEAQQQVAIFKGTVYRKTNVW